MRRKDDSVECLFHWHLTNFLATRVDEYYRGIGREYVVVKTQLAGEAVITSGSESGTHHGYTSLHYAIPGCAADVRSWDVIDEHGEITDAVHQCAELNLLAHEYCDFHGLSTNTIEVILEGDHIHIEFQPKRGDR